MPKQIIIYNIKQTKYKVTTFEYVCISVYITNVMRMGVCVARTYMCLRMFVVKTEEVKKMIESYLRMCEYVCMRVIKKRINSSRVYVCPLTECVCM